MNLRDRLLKLSDTELVRRMVLGAVLGEPPCRRLIPSLSPSGKRRYRDEGASPPTPPAPPSPARDEKR